MLSAPVMSNCITIRMNANKAAFINNFLEIIALWNRGMVYGAPALVVCEMCFLVCHHLQSSNL